MEEIETAEVADGAPAATASYVAAQSHLEDRTGFLTREISETLIQQIEAFGEEKAAWRRPAFYKSPRIRQFWGEEQEEVESFREIFFDLIYVAVAFQVGKVLEELIADGGGSGAGIFFTAQFFALYLHWLVRMDYLARFQPNSIFHTLVDVIYATLLSLMALFVSKESDILVTIGRPPIPLKNDGSFNSALGFSICSLLLTILNMCRGLEVIFVVRKYGLTEDIDEITKERERKAALNTAKFDLLRGFTYAICVCLSVIGAYFGEANLFVYPFFLGFLVIVGLLFCFALIVSACSTKPPEEEKNRKAFELVPINVEWVLHRQIEFSMLMLGEGVLQIIITDIDFSDLTGHFLTFILSFLLICSLYALNSYALPSEPEESALRKSRNAAFLVGLIKPFQYSTIIGVGVALKLILKEQAKLEEKNDERRALSVFLLFAVLWILLDRMFNHGFNEIFLKETPREGQGNNIGNNWNYPRIIFSLIWVCSPVMFLSLTYIELNGPLFLLVALAFFVVIAFLGMLEYKLFLRGREEETLEDEIKLDEDSKVISPSDNRILSMSQGRSSSARSKRGGCTLFNTLQYIRKTTRIIHAEVRQAAQTENYESFDWRKEVNNMRKLVNIVDASFEAFEQKLLASRKLDS